MIERLYPPESTADKPHLSLDELARELGTSVRTVQRWHVLALEKLRPFVLRAGAGEDEGDEPDE